MRITELLEATVINKKHDGPITDDMTIRVYHGAYEIETVLTALLHGLTGKAKVPRRYSYEANNNPSGLFVTPDLKTAKEFGDYILELHVRVHDLEAPVWPSGGFTGQGQMASYFNSDDDREIERIRQRDRHKQSNEPNIANSDRPELAAWLLSPAEPQALFKGNLNPNSIRAVWVSKNPDRVDSPFARLSTAEFMQKYSKEGIAGRAGYVAMPDDKPSEMRSKAKQKLVKPREMVDAAEFLKRLGQKCKHLPQSKILSLVKQNPDYIKRFVWNDDQYNHIAAGLDGAQ